MRMRNSPERTGARVVASRSAVSKVSCVPEKLCSGRLTRTSPTRDEAWCQVKIADSTVTIY